MDAELANRQVDSRGIHAVSRKKGADNPTSHGKLYLGSLAPPRYERSASMRLRDLKRLIGPLGDIVGQ